LLFVLLSPSFSRTWLDYKKLFTVKQLAGYFNLTQIKTANLDYVRLSGFK
jgi:hypothetical protein